MKKYFLLLVFYVLYIMVMPGMENLFSIIKYLTQGTSNWSKYSCFCII
jgi:hypothetical protein